MADRILAVNKEQLFFLLGDLLDPSDIENAASTNEPNLNGFSIIEIFRNETFRKDTKNKDA